MRLIAAFILGLLIAGMAKFLGVGSGVTQAILGYDVGVLTYILWAFWLMYTSDSVGIRKRAISQDDGKFIVLLLVILAVLFSICVIFVDLASLKNIEGVAKYQRLVLVVTTIVLSWFFMNFVFTLHYAHDYYFDVQKHRPGGLEFLPAEVEPCYFDFLYFASVIGATAQTADVAISSKKMRRTCLLHSILAFFFNTTILALSINIASGLI